MFVLQMNVVALHENAAAGYAKVPDGFSATGDGTHDDKLPFRNTLCGACGSCTWIAWALCLRDKWNDLGRDYYLYQATTQNRTLSKERALEMYTNQATTMGGEAGMNQMMFGPDYATAMTLSGCAEKASDTLRTLRNPGRRRQLRVDVAESCEACFAPCCVLARNSQEVAGMTAELQQKREALGGALHMA